ncbi:DUF4192 domain-containing protein [Actinotalea subterranea]|uniref:DUF4192 domain-containing protein n=1 Tax=Actinotalea subterranea TaxID=2607497 RepID=UPI0011EBC7A8|nr:DUF4192 domain-containing protein [Actinotalea subterranea]
MPTTIRTREPRELLALIPFQLGFRPVESLVLVSIRGDRARVGLVARVDLADVAHPEHGPQVARSLVSHMVADGARRCVAVVYTDQATGGAAVGHPTRAVAHVREAGEHFLDDMAAWVVSSSGYFALGCEDTACCPPGGRPLSELESTEVGAHMVLTGARVVETRAELGRIALAPAEARRSARRAAHRWTTRLERAGSGSELHAWRREGLALWRDEVAHAREALEAVPGAREGGGTAVGEGASRGPLRRPVPPVHLGRLQASLQDVLVRDAVMLSFIPGTDRVGDRVVAGDASADVGTALRAIVDPVDGAPPDPLASQAATGVLEAVVGHSPRRAQAPGLTLLGVLAWWAGDGARAGALIERALTIDPRYRLAVLMEETLAAGMPPGWLRGGATAGPGTAG